MSDLADFAKSVDWTQYIDDNEIKEGLEELKERIDELGGDEDGDMDDAARIKLVVVGDGAVGKTCLLISYASGKFPEEYVPTVFENYTAPAEYQKNKVLLQLWDTAGQEDYDRLRPLSYPGTNVVLLCFCLVSVASYEAIEEKWAPEVQHYLSDVPLILVGTKVDLRDQNEKDPHADDFEPISKEKGQELANELNCAAYVEVSALNRQGLDEVFQKAIKAVIDSGQVEFEGSKPEPEKPKVVEEKKKKKPEKPEKPAETKSKPKPKKPEPAKKTEDVKEDKRKRTKKDKKETKVKKKKKEEKKKGGGLFGRFRK